MFVVIHLILSPTAGEADIPSLLRGDAPPSDDANNLGTKKHSKRPEAIVLGAGYKDADVATMREACRGGSNVPWLRPDLSKPAPPLGPDYGKAMVQRAKSCLKGLEKDGKIGGDGVFFF